MRPTKDDLQAAAKLVRCTGCQRAFYMTVRRIKCRACRKAAK